MNNYTENTLKRWLKRKVKVTLGMMVAFMITGTVGFAEVIAPTYGNGNLEISGGEYGNIYVGDIEKTVTEGIGNINNATVNGDIYATNADYGVIKDVELTIKNTIVDGIIYMEKSSEEGSSSVLNTENLTVTNAKRVNGSSYAKGIALNDGSIGNFGGDYLNIDIKGESTESVVGIQVFGSEAKFSLKETNINVESKGSSSKWGFGLLVNGSNGGKAIFDGGNVNISSYTKDYTTQTLTAKKKSEILFNNSGDINITSTSEFGVTGVDNDGGKISFNNKGNVTIYGEILPGDKTGATNVVGIQSGAFANNSETEITANVKDFSIILKGAGVDNDGTSYSTGTKAVTIDIGDKFLVDSNTFNIKMDIAKDLINTPPDGHTSNQAYGLDSVGGTIKIGENTTTNIEINQGQGDVYAVHSKGSAGSIDILGDTYIKANGTGKSYALYAENDSTINVVGENKTVQIDGDIKSTDSTININLTGENSYINGSINEETSSSTITLANTETSASPKGINVVLKDGATWNNNNNSSFGKLTMDNGIINNGLGKNITIGNYTGTGTVNMETSKEEDGSFKTGSLSIGVVNREDELEDSLDINFTGITADDIVNDINGNLGKLSGNITGEGIKSIDTTVRVEEGLTEGAITGNLGENGELNTSTIKQNKTTTTMDGLQALSTNMYIAWKQEMNSLNKRMGELRNSTGNEGVWARVYAGESEYNKGYENKYQTYQVGYDKKYSTDNGTGFVGYLVSYTQGDTDYSHNSYVTGDNTAVGGGIYGTWLGNNGDYVDVIFKVSRLENKYDVTSLSGINSSGDYNTFGMSLSTEYGRRFNLTKGFFIKPSVEMSLGRVGAEDYRTSSGLNVEQDTIYTAEGRVGTALGYNFDKGNVYVRVAGVKEFAGELDTTINGKTMTEDLGDSWIEYGIGANYRVLENLNLYVDFERTGSAEVQTNWQGNLGFRYEF
ncbi:autotransporter outer membrane beta-barrel domain-containing protein [Fusobacterium sp. FSA-380-WT-3A]|uniref:autotransporter outer membrane beta-barrel domain-containing protein n=2 Tax=Fusobacterium TaxID=848 RepID=UPI001476C4D5|nr:autotransporter outer membrane beta-barrel domain-containing protein [Fusobacterium sp. FSA-380-WT-3A]NME36083.1 autotransporter outer membrane beta-barrel domain-containing protein [Fusobacterium sp. FSA-380-WT-3A]